MEKENQEQPYKNNSMTEHLGIKFMSYDLNMVCSEMAVDNRTCQPFGYLNGGAAAALAEITAGYGSMKLCNENEIPNGMQITANHISSVKVGNTVTAMAQLIHKGKSTHVWNVDITTHDGRLVSTARIVNFIITRK